MFQQILILQNKVKLKKTLIRLAVLLFWLGVWQGVFMLVNQEILIVSPLQVIERIFELVITADFWKNVGFSFLRIIGGYMLGIVIAVIFACLMSISEVADELLYPVVSLAKSTPVASFIILALVWLKKDYVPLFIVFLIVLPVVCGSLKTAISETDKVLVETAKIYKFSFFKTVKTVYLGSVLPSFVSSSVTALGLAWKSGVAAEVIAMPLKSIGYNLYRSKINIETKDLFAWTAIVIILSVLLEKLIKIILLKLSGVRYDKNHLS